MSFTLRVRPRATRDIDRFTAYLSEFASKNVSHRFLTRLKELFGKLEKHPEHGSRWDSSDPTLEDTLYRTPKRFKNHVVFYQVHGDNVEIIRVLHASQDIDQALHEIDE